MAEASDEKKPKTKRPTALKREIQSEKRRLINKAFKSSLKTAMNTLDAALEKKNKDEMDTSLNALYSLLDRAVKRGIFKVNKAGRTKARLSAKVASVK